MGVTRFESQVVASTVGTADIDKLSGSFDKLAASIDGSKKKADEVAQHPGFDHLAEKIKSGIEDPLGAAAGAMDNVLKSIGPMGAAVAAGVGIFAAAGVAAFEAAHSLGEYGTQIANVAARTGLTTKEVGQFSFAAKLAGQDVGVFESAMRKLSQGLDDTSVEGKKARAGLADIGVSAYESTGKMRPMSEIFLQISEGLNRIEEPAKRNAEALKIFGRAGIELLPTILGLAENVKLAKDIGLGASESDVRRWEEYHRQLVEVEAQWGRLKRSVAEPLAATAIFTIKHVIAPGSAGVFAMLSLPGRALFSGQQTATDVEMSETGGFGFGASMSRADHEREADAVRRNNAAVEAARTGTPEMRLDDAKQKLADLRAGLKLGVLPSENADQLDKIQKQADAVRGIEAEIKATKDLVTAKEAVFELEKRSAELYAKGYFGEANPTAKLLSANGKIDAERADALRKSGQSPELTARINASFDEQKAGVFLAWLDETSAGLAKLNKSIENMIDDQFSPAKITENAKRIMDASEVELKGTGFLDGQGRLPYGFGRGATPYGQGFVSPEETLRRARDAERRSASLYGLQSGLAGESDVAQTAGLYSLRVRGAAEEYAALQRIAEAKTNEADRESARQDAIDQWEQRMFDARLERDQQLLSLALRMKEEFQSLVVGGIDALFSGQGGAFLKQAGTGIFNRVLGNAAGMGWDSVRKAIPHADADSTAGKLLQGTFFGADPLKNATTANTMATIENTAALRAMALSSSSGGGGFSASGVARLFSGSGEAGEEGSGWFSGGNGDWAGETDNPADISSAGGGGGGGFSFARGAGIAAAAAGGGFGIYSGIRQGGARGGLTAAGSAVAMLGALLPQLSKTLSVAGPIGMIAGLGLGLITTMLPDPKKVRDQQETDTLNAARYQGPTASNYTRDRYGRGYDTDIAGNMRPLIQITMPVQAIDSKDFEDRAPQLMNIIASGIEDGHTRFSMAVRNVVRGRG